jgi:hypothetical protein
MVNLHDTVKGSRGKKFPSLKGQSHEKVGELWVWGVGLGPNKEQLRGFKLF